MKSADEWQTIYYTGEPVLWHELIAAIQADAIEAAAKVCDEYANKALALAERIGPSVHDQLTTASNAHFADATNIRALLDQNGKGEG